MPQEYKGVEENSENKNYPFNTARIFDPDEILLSNGEVQRILRISKSRIYALISKGEFPPSVRIGQSKRFWLKSEILAYAQSRLDERNKKLIQKRSEYGR